MPTVNIDVAIVFIGILLTVFDLQNTLEWKVNLYSEIDLQLIWINMKYIFIVSKLNLDFDLKPSKQTKVVILCK